jgi:hypothetical protein
MPRKSTQKLGQEHEERAIFEPFLKAYPCFADEEILKWEIAECDPPDVICVTTSGQRVGVEICQWAHEGEMRAGNVREAKERKLLDAIGVPQPKNTSKNFCLAVFFPRAKVNITPSGYPAFRQSLFQLIEYVDATWSTDHGTRNYRFGELHRFPPVDKYLERVISFAPGEAFTSDVDWILPVGHADFFDDRTMADPLLRQIAKKKEQCRVRKTDCDDLYLLIAYDQALSYCSPIGTPHRRGVDETAREAAAALAADCGPFSRAFLFIAVEPGLRGIRLL